MSTLSLFSPEIAFDGWAVALIVFLLSLIGIGVTGLIVKQKQKAGDWAKQNQTVKSSQESKKKNIRQKQKAGDNSEQNQSA